MEQIRSVRQKLVDKVGEYHFLLKPTLIAAGIYLLAISAILQSDFYYVDDLGRALHGYTGWENFSRYLSVFLSYILHTDDYLADISPLPQLLAVFLLAVTSILVIYIITEDKKITFWKIAAVLPLGLSPYFLECLSYKYDAPYMVLSVLLSIFPLLFYRKNEIAYCVISAVCIVGMCTTYQVSAGIYPMLVGVVCLRRWMRRERFSDILVFILESVLSFLVGMLIFRLAIMHEVSGYTSTEFPAVSELIPTAVRNYKAYWNYLLNDFKTEWLVVMVLVGVGFVFATIFNSECNKLASFLLAAAALIFIAAMSLGVYPFLSNPIFYPRSMYGIGVALSFMAVHIFSCPKVKVSKIACLILSWCFFIFSFAYGNALSVQSTYTDYRITAVIHDLMDTEAFQDNDPKTIKITGNIGYAPVIRNMSKDYDILKRLVPVTFDGEWYWGRYGFANYYGLTNVTMDTSEETPDDTLPVLAENILHTIRGTEEYLWIELK